MKQKWYAPNKIQYTTQSIDTLNCSVN